jgi:hypothetical protein
MKVRRGGPWKKVIGFYYKNFHFVSLMKRQESQLGPVLNPVPPNMKTGGTNNYTAAAAVR